MSVYRRKLSPAGELCEILKIDARQPLVLEYSHEELEEIELCYIPSCITQNLCTLPLCCPGLLWWG